MERHAAQRPHWANALGALALLLALALLAAPSLYAQKKLIVLAHRVHKIVATEGEGGDVAKEWSQKTGVEVEWQTFSTGPLHERLFREGSLSQTTVGVAFLLNTSAVPAVFEQFEPLNDLMKSDPIEDFQDFFPGMVQAMTVNGKLYGIPFRHSTSGLHYNEALFKERGIARPPATVEELVEDAKKLTYTRADGSKVYGFVINGPVIYTNTVDLARAWDGDFIDLNYKVRCNEPPMVRAVTVLRELYEAGAIPKAFPTIETEDINTWIQTGRAAMALGGMGRTQFYNDPKQSKFPGQIKVTNIPISRELQGKYAVAPAKVEFWSMVIPKNYPDKKLAWSFIKSMASKDVTLRAALNGNGPTRNSTYDDPRFAGKLSYAQEERKVLKVGRVPLPPFDGAPKAQDMFAEETQAAILGFKTPQQAMDDLARRVAPMLPK